MTLAGAVLFAASSLAVDDSALAGWFFWIGAGSTVAGGVWQWTQHKGVMRTEDQWRSKLDQEREGLNAAKATITRLEGEIETLLAPDEPLAAFLLERILIDLGIDGPRSRASLYVRAAKGGDRLIARYSADSVLRRPGTSTYQPTQGAVARAWSAPYVDPQLPVRPDVWARAMHEKYGIAPEDVSQLRMKAGSLAAVPIVMPRGATTETVGVLMIEHLDRYVIDAQKQDELFANPLLLGLGELCSAQSAHAALIS